MQLTMTSFQGKAVIALMTKNKKPARKRRFHRYWVTIFFVGQTMMVMLPILQRFVNQKY
jgi:hypothetical protein